MQVDVRAGGRETAPTAGSETRSHALGARNWSTRVCRCRVTTCDKVCWWTWACRVGLQKAEVCVWCRKRERHVAGDLGTLERETMGQSGSVGRVAGCWKQR